MIRLINKRNTISIGLKNTISYLYCNSKINNNNNNGGIAKFTTQATIDSNKKFKSTNLTKVYAINNIDQNDIENNKELSSNGDQLKKQLKMIDDEPFKEDIYYDLYLMMVKSNIGEVTLLNGTKLSLIDVLVREIGYHKNNINPLLNLCALLLDNSTMNEPVTIDHYHGNDGNQFIFKETTQTSAFGSLGVCLFIDPNNAAAYQLLTPVVIDNNIPSVRLPLNNLIITKSSIIYNNYILNKSNDPNCYLYMELEMELSQRIQIPETSIVQNKADVLIDGISHFPMVSGFYYRLSKLMTNNYQKIKFTINNVPPKSIECHMNRIELVKLAINLELKSPFIKNSNNINLYYAALANLLESNDEMVIVGDTDINSIEYNRIQLLIKSIENSDDVQGIHNSKKDLFDCLLNDNDTVSINSKTYSKYDLIKSIFDGNTKVEQQFSFKMLELLLDHYKYTNDHQQFNHYNQLLQTIRNKVKSELISNIENDPENADYYLQLSRQLPANSNEVVNIGNGKVGKSMNKQDLILKAIDLYQLVLKPIELYPNLSEAFYELSKLLPLPVPGSNPDLNNLPSIKLLNGQTMDMAKLLETNSDYFNAEKLYQVYSFIPNDYIQNKIFCLSSCIASNEKFSEPYLPLGILLQETNKDSIKLVHHFEEDIGITSSDFVLSRKQLFINSIKYDKSKLFNPLKWYHLSLEMNNGDKEFGKSKKEILEYIISNDKLFLRAYGELSLLQSTNQSDKIKLLLNAIKLEKELNIKSDHYFNLANCLSPVDKVTIIDSNGDKKELDKNQILVKSIEIYPHTSKKPLIYRLLAENKKF